MQFDIISLVLNPFVLMFITIALGLLFGKIKFGKFSFGASGALFVGLIVGWAVYKYANGIYTDGDTEAAGYATAAKIFEENGGKLIHQYFFSASLIFFVAAVGLLAAKDLGIVLRKYGAKFVVLGLLITLVGAGATYGATTIIKSTNAYAVSGVYTGALTSSPGLASALETSEKHAAEAVKKYNEYSSSDKEKIINIINLSDDFDLNYKEVKSLTPKMEAAYISSATSQVGMGYAVGYPFGVVIVILAVNFLNVIFKFDVEEEKRRYTAEMSKARSTAKVKEIPTVSFSILAFSVVCFVGYLLGSLSVYLGPLGYVSLESTGGILIASLALGYIGKIGPLNFRMDPKTLAVVRELGLVFFLAIVGLNYGYGAINAIFSSGLVLALVSLVVGTIAIMVGFFVGRYVFKINWVMLSGAICGGMTSTPGLGAATDAIGSDDPGAGYGATYPFALFGMIIFTIIMYKLPLL
ncbi:MAG: hypothetical protein RR918_07620 [Anaerovoracaceae bacterium]